MLTGKPWGVVDGCGRLGPVLNTFRLLSFAELMRTGGAHLREVVNNLCRMKCVRILKRVTPIQCYLIISGI